MTTYRFAPGGTCSRSGCNEPGAFRSGRTTIQCAKHFASWFHWYSRWMNNETIAIYQQWAQELGIVLSIREPRWRPPPRWKQLELMKKDFCQPKLF